MAARRKTLCVVGLGYVGLPTAAVFASHGVDVIGVDIDPRIVRLVNEGSIHIPEPDLDMVVHAAVKAGRLRATARPEAADAFIIAVPTPLRGSNEADLSYVEASTRSIAPVLKKGDLVVLESTSPIGVTERIAKQLACARPDLRFPGERNPEPDVNIAYCPERVLPGRVMREILENDRIVGGITAACSEAAGSLYGIFLQGRCHTTDVRTAEMCKLAENAFRDVNIAFANELSLIAARHDIDVWEIIRLANHHPRVNILQPGCGVGGHCIAVDPWFLAAAAPDDANLIPAARRVNDGKTTWIIEQVLTSVEGLRDESGEAPRVACMGLTFKPDVDDLRGSPALRIACELRDRGVEVLAVEPNLREHPDWQLWQPGAAIAAADLVIFLVRHRSFLDLDCGDAPVLDFCGVRRIPHRAPGTVREEAGSVRTAIPAEPSDPSRR